MAVCYGVVGRLIIMLFILTGNVQIGKTRWLGRMLEKLEGRGITPYGVIAPGTWIEHADESGVTYEKTGIDNELLPQHEVIPFARRADLAAQDASGKACTQAQRAQLAWAIEDDAIDRVNAHFDELAMRLADAGQPDEQGRGLVVVDEFGRLELLRDEGLTSAMRVIEQGATPRTPHALIIVREQLLDIALDRFAQAGWNGVQPISPDEAGEQALLDAYSE